MRRSCKQGNRSAGSLRKWLPAIAPIVFLVGADQPKAEVAAVPLTRIEQITSLTPQEASETKAVRLTAVVTFWAPEWTGLFVHDSTGGAYVQPPRGAVLRDLDAGDRIRIEGTTSEWTVKAARIEVLGRGTLPDPLRISFEEASSRIDLLSQWVEVKGEVLKAGREGRWLLLTLSSAEGELDVKVRESPAFDPALLIGAPVRARGVCGAKIDGRQNIVGAELLSPHFSQIEILDPERRAALGRSAADARTVAPEAPVDREALGRDLPVLGSVRQVRELSQEEAAKGYPVRLQGVVTYYGGFGFPLFVQDPTGGIYVQAGEDLQNSIVAGRLVRLQGVTSPGDFAPIIVDPVFDVQEQVGLPQAPPVTFQELSTGALDSQWAEVEGVVRSAAVDTGHLRLELALRGGPVEVRIPGFWDVSEAPSALVDAGVRVQGAVGSIFNERRQLTGVRLFTPDPSHLVVEAPVPEDPFDVPAVAISRVLSFSPARRAGHRVKVRGIVTLQGGNRRVFLQDATGGMLVENSDEANFEPGDEVEVLGFPAFGEASPYLQHSTLRKLGRVAVPEAVTVTPEQVLEGNLDALLIRIRGLLLEKVLLPDELLLILEADGTLFQAGLERTEAAARLAEVRSGSRLEVTGVSTVKADESRMPRSFRVWLRDPQDVVVLSPAPWWRLRHTLTVLGVLLGVALAGLVWVVLLRRRVAEQTATIRSWLRKEAAARQRYQNLFENANDAVFVCDLKARVTAMNRAGERLTGYDRVEIRDKTVFDLMPADQVPAARRMFERLLEGMEGKAADWVLLDREGRRIWLEVTAGPVLEEGIVVGIQGIARDVSDRKRAEQELRQAEEAARAASRAKSEFLAVMSHEIRTPLNGILGMTDLTLETELTGEQREFLTLIRRSGRALLAIINDILDFSKIEAGRLGLDVTPFGLEEVTGSVLKALAPQAESKGIELVLQVAPDVPSSVVGDAGRLRQILLNLVGNAVKFTERGHVCVEVSRVDDSRLEVPLEFRVEDTGIGIAFEKQKEIFEAFVQADASTTRTHGGTGLGLAISKRLVEAMGGEIELESTPGHGSTFRFRVRLQEASAVDDGRIKAPVARLDEVPVLVCAGNEALRDSLASTLRGWGACPRAVDSMDEGLEELRRARTGKTPFRLVLLDARVIDFESGRLAPETAEEAASAGTEILLLTNPTAREEAEALRNLGFREQVAKPILPSELLEACLRLLGLEVRPGEARKQGRENASSRRPKVLHVLLAEDDAVNRRLALHLLKRRGHSAATAENGRKAVELWRRGNFDVVLMDVQMPEMDGLEATRRIRRAEEGSGRRTPVAALTAHALKGDRERCLAAGMDAYLPKPLTADALDQVLDELAAPTASPTSGLEDFIGEGRNRVVAAD